MTIQITGLSKAAALWYNKYKNKIKRMKKQHYGRRQSEYE